jgi:hypothetical protein
MTAAITGTRASATMSWTLNMTIEPGSVPDRPMKHSRDEKTYRPDTLNVAFAVCRYDPDLHALVPELLGPARSDIRMGALSIQGQRVLSDGRSGAQRHSENFYGGTRDVPDWALALIASALSTLNGT